MSNINYGAFSEVVNNKADRDLGNINPTQGVVQNISNWGVPDYTAAISLTVDNTERTVTDEMGLGYIYFRIHTLGGATNYLFINGTQFDTYEWDNHNQDVWTPFLVKPGDTYRWYTTGQGSIIAKFIPLSGL